ncbi:MAG: hypothetical protein ABGW77_05260, partial [Campylobacterales bacterium]
MEGAFLNLHPFHLSLWKLNYSAGDPAVSDRQIGPPLEEFQIFTPSPLPVWGGWNFQLPLF